MTLLLTLPGCATFFDAEYNKIRSALLNKERKQVRTAKLQKDKAKTRSSTAKVSKPKSRTELAKVAKPKTRPEVATVATPKARVEVAKVAKPSKPTIHSETAQLPKPTPRKETAEVAVNSSASERATPTCGNPDHGFGIYHPWVNNLALGHMLLPKQGAITADNGFDLIIHFHGGDAVRKYVANNVNGVFIVGVGLGAGSAAYERPFQNPAVFRKMLADIEKAVAQYTGNRKVHLRHLALTGWSAGYGAIRAILRQPEGRKVDAVVLLDGLHANYDSVSPKVLRDSQLSPFVNFAKRAAAGEKYMFVSHSSIIPPGYASTTETTHYLVEQLGGSVQRSQAMDSPYLSRYEQAVMGNFTMRGYQGEEKGDHCAQIALITRAVEEIEKRWSTPLAQGKLYASPSSAATAQAALGDSNRRKS